jgi:hypothetical protein
MIRVIKELILFFISTVIAVGGVSAQNLLFPTKVGLTLDYANLNARGNVENFTRQTIKNVEGSGDNLTVSYVSQVLDKNRKPISDPPLEISYTVVITNGVVEWDMKSYATAGTESFLQIEGDKLLIPSTMQGC